MHVFGNCEPTGSPACTKSFEDTRSPGGTPAGGWPDSAPRRVRAPPLAPALVAFAQLLRGGDSLRNSGDVSA